MTLTLLTLTALIVTQSIESDIKELLNDHINVALSSWGYSHATASSSYGPSYGPERAIDGRWASREENKWNTALGKGPHWLILDLGHAFTFDHIVVRHEGVYGDGEIYNTSDFAVQQADSDKGPWRDIVPPIKNNHDNISLIKFVKTRSRYVRFVATQAEQKGNAFARIFEIEVYAPKDAIDVPLISLSFPATPTFRHMNGKLESAVQVQANATAKLDRFQVNGHETSLQDGLIWIPVNGKPSKIVCLQKDGVSPTWSMKDDRSWILGINGGSIDILSSSHQDVAWMDTPDACRDARVQYILEPAIDLMNRESNYHFTMENMLNLMELLQERPARREQIAKLLKNGQLEFGGTYNQPYESLLGGEQLIRQTYFGRRWLRKQFPGADTCVAYSVDVPGRSLQMQQILAKAGIRYFVTSRYHEGLFQWGSPDGSNILLYALPHYGFHNSLLKSNPISAVKEIPQAIQTEIRDFASHQIPPHYMLLNSGDMEGPMSFGPLLSEWSKPSSIALMDGKPISKPSLDYSSTAGLFKSLDVSTAKPSQVSGERPNMWLYIHGPTHHEAIQAQRDAARLLPVAETFATMRCLVEGSFASYPTEKLSNGWLDSLYPDHGFGGYNGHITDGVFHAKFASGRDAALSSLGESLPALASHVKVDATKGTPVVVFNPHSWPRSDTVSVEAPTADGDWSVVDASGKPVVSQTSIAPRHENVATAARGARVLRSSGKKGDRLIDLDWWDARKEWWETPVSASNPAEAVIDLGRMRSIDRVLIRHFGALGQFEKEVVLNTRSFRLFGSNDADVWVQLVSPVTRNDEPISVFEFAPKNVRYIKLEIVDPSQGVDKIARIVGIEAQGWVQPERPLITFTANDLPSLGYRTYYLAHMGDKQPSRAKEAGQTIENDFYRIQLKPGGVASVYDKQAKTELFRQGGLTAGEVFTLQSVGNGAGEFGAVQQPTMEGFDRTSAHAPEWKRLDDRSGSVKTVFELVQPMGGAKVRQTLTVYHQKKKIDFDVDLEGWIGTKYREFRLALPIGGPKSKVSYEVPLGTVTIGKDEIKTTGGVAYGGLDYWQKCSDIHPREVQDFIRVQDGSLTTTVSSSVSVFDFLDPTGLAGKGPLIQPILLASRRSCHGAGNWYTQPGDHHFHFSLTSSTQANSGWREAADAQLPLMAALVSKTDNRLPSIMSFASLSTPNVRISTIKKAEDDDSVIVRCYDVDGKTVDLRVRLFVPFVTAKLCNIIEDEQKPLAVDDGSAVVHVGRFAIETVKLKLEK